MCSLQSLCAAIAKNLAIDIISVFFFGEDLIQWIAVQAKGEGKRGRKI